MKNITTSSETNPNVLQNLKERAKHTILVFPVWVLVAGLVLAACPAQAVNLLQNPGFEVNSGHSCRQLDAFWAIDRRNISTSGNYWM